MRTRWLAGLALGALGALAVLTLEARASSHREAPFITKNPKVDGTDFYMFRSYETSPSDRSAFVTLIANYLPLQDAYGGPNYFSLDPEALYEIHVDNSGDGSEDITFQFRFQNTLTNSGNGIQLPVGSGATSKMVSIPLLNAGGISAASNAALNIAETYTIKVVRGNRRTGTAMDVSNAAGGATTFKKPTDFIGTKTFSATAPAAGLPAGELYSTYARAHIHTVSIPGCATAGSRVFVGQRREGFAVNLGTIFDLVNAPAAAITGANRDLGANVVANKNVTTIALEVPIACLKQGSENVIGGWTTASVRQARVINPRATFARPSREGGAWTQVSRLGSPLVNEVVIGLKDKDKFNGSHPSGDAQFADYVTNPTLPELIELLFGGGSAIAPDVFPRADLVQTFLTGVPGVNAFAGTPVPAEMLRLNTALPVTAPASQNSLGAMECFMGGAVVLPPTNPACDPAGFPNGRRPGDDVTDVALRVVMGRLLATHNGIADVLHDGALNQASQFDNQFPYLKDPLPGAP